MLNTINSKNHHWNWNWQNKQLILKVHTNSLAKLLAIFQKIFAFLQGG